MGEREAGTGPVSIVVAITAKTAECEEVAEHHAGVMLTGPQRRVTRARDGQGAGAGGERQRRDAGHARSGARAGGLHSKASLPAEVAVKSRDGESASATELRA